MIGRRALLIVFTALVAVPALAQEPAPVSSGKPTVFIRPTEDGFQTYLAAAILKKKVPVAVTAKEEGATYILEATAIETKKVSTGAKWANCLFAYCAGNDDKGSTSVQLLKGDEIAWSYSVNKGRGQKNKQSLAEAIAKHLKSDFFDEIGTMR